jgi:hypothetical protein
MDQTNTDLKLDGIRGDIRESVVTFAQRLISELADNLESITVVGSSLNEDFVPEQSDINSVVVLGKQDMNALTALAKMARAMGKKKLSAPLLMTQEYISRSCDVFGVEFLDFQLSHETIFGADPFEKLKFSKSDVRLQCERELKATLIRIRQAYIASAAEPKLMRDVLTSTAKSLSPLLRAMLWLSDIERPRTISTTFDKAASEFSIDIDGLVKTGSWRGEKIRPDKTQINTVLESIYSTVDKLAVIVDALEA